MKYLHLGLIIGILIGLTAITLIGWKLIPNTDEDGIMKEVIGGTDDYMKGEQRVLFKEKSTNQPIQIVLRLGILFLCVGLGLGLGNFFDEMSELENEEKSRRNNENNNP
jgi:hypothetical protein